MNFNNTEEEFDFFKNKAYKIKQKIRQGKTEVYTSMFGLFCITIFAISLVPAQATKTVPLNKDKTFEIVATSNPSIPEINTQIIDKEKVLKQLTEDVKKYEKDLDKNIKNSKNEKISNANESKDLKVITKEGEQATNKDIEKVMGNYAEKIKNNKFSEKDLKESLQFLEKLKKQDLNESKINKQP